MHYSCKHWGTKFPCCILHIFTCTKPLPLRREASVRMQPAHKHISTFSHHCTTIISCPCTECKNVALGGVDTSFFSLFSTKKHAFLHFFTAFCTFLLNNDFFCGAATVGSALRALFDCFLVVFMLKYQGGHGV